MLQIWGVVADQTQVSVQQRQDHYHNIASHSVRRRSSTSETDEPEEVRRPGQQGFVMRARVPRVLPRDYAHRAESKISMEEREAKIDRNTVSTLSTTSQNYFALGVAVSFIRSTPLDCRTN